MKWAEFAALLGGLSEDTVLARVASIRTENDPERLKHFTPAQHRIRNAWRNKAAMSMSEADVEAVSAHFSRLFQNMAGGG